VRAGRSWTGCWTAGVTASGNAAGLPHEAWQSLSDRDRAARLARAEQVLHEAQPDFVVPTVESLLPVIDAIEERLRQGIGPGRGRVSR
jgi:phosphonoacetaldehyde hydrolase